MAATVTGGQEEAGVDKDQSIDEFITLPKPMPFTQAKVNSIEYRPAAVLHFCQFLNTITAKCKADLVRLGCVRHHHGHAATTMQHHGAKPSLAQKNHPQHQHHKHGDKEPWEKRMQRLKVYQRAFSSIVMHFKAYCPVLFHIKKTYEDMLSYRIDQIKMAHFERKRLHIHKHNMRMQMNEYQFPEYDKLQKSEKCLNILRQRITLQEEAIKTITGNLKKMEEALSDHFERHRDLEEQIIMVDTEITNRRQKAFSMREKEEREAKESEGVAENLTFIDTDEEDADDPFYNVEEIDEERKMVWIMAFAICHKDLEDAERKINLYQTKYQYVVPRHEHENMKRTIVDEKFTAKQLADEKSNLEAELANLKSTEEKMGEELTQVKSQLTDLRTLVTQLGAVGRIYPGWSSKMGKMIQGKSTKDVTEKLFSELRGRRGGEKYLTPLGIEPSVMRCLRYAKKVADRQIHSRDAALLIHDIWMERKAALLENKNTPQKEQNDFDFGKTENLATKNFPDYVACYFENMYEDVDQRMEWTYNIVECCKRFSLDYRLIQFLSVLQFKSDEGLYTATRNELFRIRNSFLQKSVQEGMKGGTLSSNQYVEALESTFPKKSESELQSLVRVTNKLNAELNAEEGADLSTYRVTQLIDMRDDGFRGALVSEIVKQFETNRQLFIDKVIEELAMQMDISPAAALRETDPVGDKDTNVVQVFSALQKADGDMDDVTAGAALAWMFTGTSVVPGCGISTSRLVNYVKLHRNSKGDDKDSAANSGQMDDEKFERAIKDILRDVEENESEPQMSDAQRKAYYKAHKHAKLRTIVKRLRGSALVPSWQAYDPSSSVLPELPVDPNKDLAALADAVKKEMELTTVGLPNEVERLGGSIDEGQPPPGTDAPAV